MRNFGTLHGRVSRGISAQAALRNYPSPLYMQHNTGYPYGTYGSPAGSQPMGNYYSYYEQGPASTKEDVKISGIQQGGQVASTFIQSLFGYKTAQLQAQPDYTTGASTSYTTSSSGSGSGAALGIIALVVLAGGVGFWAFTR